MTGHRDSAGVGTTWSDAGAASETSNWRTCWICQRPPLELTVFCFARPAPNFYFPSLHQLKFEIEDGVTPNSRPVRFGFDRREFPDFSWRGYAVMSPAQVRTDGVHAVQPAHPECCYLATAEASSLSPSSL